MNLKTTLALLVLAAAAVAVCLLLSPLSPWPGLLAGTPDAGGTGTVQVLEEQFLPDRITHVEVRFPSAERPVILDRDAAGKWVAPGGWDTRKPEVEELIGILAGLRSRFTPISIDEETDLAEFSLDKPALTVLVKAGPTEYRLAFGEKASASTEEGAANRLARPTYLRLDDRKEIIRLAPGLVAALSKPADYYQQRRLFPYERVVKDEASSSERQEKMEVLAAAAVAITEKQKDGDRKETRYTLKRTNAKPQPVWELSEPAHDRPDPDRLKALLAALPDLWAEQFIAKPEKDLAKYGLQEPEQVIKVTKPDGKTAITLLIGSESPTKRQRTVPPPPLPPGLPPRPLPPTTITETFRYAKLADSDQVFEIKADKLKDIFVPVADLRDPRVARFETRDATRLEIARPGDKPLVLVKDRDKDRWRLEQPLKSDAEAGKVRELLDKISGLQVGDKDVLDKRDPKIDGLDKPVKLAVTVEEEDKNAPGPKAGEKKKRKPPRTLRLEVGGHDKDKKKLYVRDEWGRINLVEGSLLSLVQRPALAYRGKRVLDFASADLQEIAVERDSKPLVTLKQEKGNWKLAAPVSAEADAFKASQLAGDLSSLDVVEFVNDAPTAEQLDKDYGLTKPALTVRLKLAGGKEPQTLFVGKQRPGKQDYYARRAADPGVFAVKKEVRDALDRDSLAYRPLQLWQALSDDITKLTIEKEGSKYTLTRQGDDWRISGPFDAAAQRTPPEIMRASLAGVTAEKCVAHKADNPTKYGLDKPYLRVGVTVREPAGATKERVLLVGKPAEGSPGARYAKLADSEAVYVVPERVVSAVDRTALDLLERRLLTLDAKSLTEVSSQRGSDRLKLEAKNGTWQVVEAPAAPFTADTGATNRLLGALASLRAQRFAAYGPKLDLAKFGLDKPEIVVTFAGKAPAAAKHKLALGKPVDGSPGERYARLDDGPGVVVLDPFTVADLTLTYLDFVDRTVLKFDAAAATAFFRKMGDDKLDIVKKDDGWQINRPAMQTADEKGMQELLDQLANLRAKRVAAYPAKDLKPFGLDEPAAQVAVRLPAGDGKTQDRILKLGKVADEATGDRFALADGSKAVAVLPGTLARKLIAAPVAFRDRNLARFPDADRVLLERGPRKATFTKVDGTWKLTAPLTAEADHDELDNFMNAVARLRADDIVADRPKDLKPYGLDKPEARWRFQSGDKDVLHLLIGGKEKDGPRHYARLANDGLVFLLDPSLTGRALAEYRSRKVWDPPPDAAQVEVVSYGYASKPFVLEKGDAGWQVQGKPEVKVNTAAVSEALAALSGLKAARYVVDRGADLKLYGLEPPELVLDVITRTGKKTIHIGRREGDTKAYYARVPGKDRSEVFIISEADAGRIVRDLGQFTQK